MEPYLVISSDCHAGLPTEQYRPYVDPDQRPAFDDMLEARNAIAATRTSNEFADRWLAENAEGLTGAWDSRRRDKELDADGVVGEVIFPDADAVTGFTGAPFGAGIGSTGRLDPTLSLAGARAHNRWLAELCADSPVRRVGVAIVPMLDDPVAAIEEVEWAAANGLRAVMIPAMWQPYPAYHDPRYDPFWAACAAANLPVHIHSGPADHEQYGPHIGIYLTEVRWWAARPLWFLIWSGVFERHPKLKFGITEGGAYWANDILWHMDTRYLGAHTSKKMSRDGIAGALTMKPSDYFDRNCFVGASNMEVIELERRYMIGVGNMLWGNDFPHPEGTWPHTREWLKSMYHNIPIDETRQMLGLNAAIVYDFDVDALRKHAEEVGPTPAELGQVDDDANRAYWKPAKERGRFWLEQQVDMQLAGRVAVVTGAAGGIGKAICDRFGHEGMRVVAADLDATALDVVVEELRAESLDVTGVPVDVTMRESVESLRDAAVDTYGAVHVVCNNAGIANTAFGNVWEHENNDWRWSLEVHLFGVINGCATFVPWLLDHGDEGWVVNTVSGNGGVVPLPDSAPYALAKASIVTYTECLFAQLRAAAGSRIGASLLFPSGYTPGVLNTGIWNESVRPPEFARSTPRPLRRGLDAWVERMRDSGQEVQFTPLEEVADQVATGILEDRFWMLAPSERTDRQIRARAESMTLRDQPDYMLPDQ